MSELCVTVIAPPLLVHVKGKEERKRTPVVTSKTPF